jgi:hypothetical protein
MELEVAAHLRSNCVLINTSKPIREQVAVSVRVRRVVGFPHQPRKNEGVLRALHRIHLTCTPVKRPSCVKAVHDRHVGSSLRDHNLYAEFPVLIARYHLGYFRIADNS